MGEWVGGVLYGRSVLLILCVEYLFLFFLFLFFTFFFPSKKFKECCSTYLHAYILYVLSNMHITLDACCPLPSPHLRCAARGSVGKQIQYLLVILVSLGREGYNVRVYGPYLQLEYTPGVYSLVQPEWLLALHSSSGQEGPDTA